MPELPEVEVTRRGIAPALTGTRITHAWLGKPLRFALGCKPGRLAGLRISEVARRGKYLLLHCPPEGTLILHLGMSGSLQWVPLAAMSTTPRTPWVHFELHTEAGVLRLDDPRRFGAAVWHEGGDIEHHKLLAGLGPEPLQAGFDGRALFAASRGKRVNTKQWLLAGKAVVGVGNIYACEALFMAGISPRKAAASLTRAQCARLAAAVQQVLAAAIVCGGSSLRDFTDAGGNRGYFQLDARVYGREGQPCRVCGTPIRRLVQGQRSTFYCPQCQSSRKPQQPRST
jgi:formamidopyrimidine-DNA glycosylase